jgi:hypothetical protein
MQSANFLFAFPAKAGIHSSATPKFSSSSNRLPILYDPVRGTIE